MSDDQIPEDPGEFDPPSLDDARDSTDSTRTDDGPENTDAPPSGPEDNPLDLDPRIGVKDLCFDRAKPGARVYVVDLLSPSVEAYRDQYPDSPPLSEYAGNVITRFDDEDAVFAVVYVKDSLTSVDTSITAYPMPESRLTRFPAEEASIVGSGSEEFERTDLPEDS